MRGNPEEGRHAFEHGTYVNGLHETWPIRHAEAAYGFARTGQTIVNAPGRQADEALRRRRAARHRHRRPRALRARPRLPRRRAAALGHLAHAVGQAGQGRLHPDGLDDPAPPRRADPRGDHALRRRTAGRLVAAAQPPGRRGRVPPAGGSQRGPRGPAQGRRLRGAGAAAPHPHGQGRPDDARLPVRELADDGRRGRRPRAAHGRPLRGRPGRRAGPHQDGLPRRRPGGQHPADREDRGLPHLARAAGARAVRPLPAHPRPGRPLRPRPLAGRAAGLVRRVLGGQRRRGRVGRPEPRRDPAGDPVQPLHARPGQRAGRRSRRRGEGGDRLGLRGPLLLGQRGLRRAVPQLHAPRARPQPHALPQPDAARRARAGPRAEPARGALPVAHHQRRGGLGLLRGRHRPGAHRRRRRPRARAVRQRHRRRGVPGARRPRDPRRDRPALRRPRVLAQQRRAVVPHPRRHRPRRVHDRRQQQPVHQRHGALQPRAGRAVGGVDPPPGAGRVRADRAEAEPHRRRGHRVGGLRGGHAHPLRRGPATSTRRTTSSSTARSGTSAAPRRSCARSCSTTTRS